MASKPPAHYLKALSAVIFCLTLSYPISVPACGWWGDGETHREDLSQTQTHDGRPLPERLSLQTAKLPGVMGYGMAVPEPGKAIPYLQATYGRVVVRIADFKAFGFHLVIDLGTPAKSAALHRAETEAAGMGYHNIPISGIFPTVNQSRRFSRFILQAADKPLLVYAPTPALLSMMWASHRLNMGSSVEFAISEGRMFGLTEAQAEHLLKRNKS